MKALIIVGFALSWVALGGGFWVAWQLLRQNGRMLLRLEELEKRLDELEFAGAAPESPGNQHNEAHFEKSGIGNPESETEQSLLASAASPGDEESRGNRFKNRSLVRSRIERDGLKAGTPAPNFRLPRLDGEGELSLEELRGKRALLVFSDPHCGPCNALAPHLEGFHRENPDTSVVVISRGEPRENRAKVREHGWTFPVVLQQQWEVSRRYAMFATPIAYLIDEAGVIVTDVAVGVPSVQALLARAASRANELEMAGG